jgi:peptide/nickel transport system permease protein
MTKNHRSRGENRKRDSTIGPRGSDGAGGTPSGRVGSSSRIPHPSRSRALVRRLLSNRGAIVGFALIGLLVVFAFLTPVVSPIGPSDIDYLALSQPPSPTHPFGTNNIGQDMFVRTAAGLQKSLIIGVLVALVSAVLAGFLGAAAGYFGGWIERVIMFLIDLLLTLPAFLFIAIMSPRLKEFGWLMLVVMISAFGWMITARVVRSMALSLRGLEYVRAARYMGIGHLTIISRHIVPQMMSFIIIDATITAGGAVMTETGLSYFGFGVQPPEVSIGNLIASGQDGAFHSPWLWGFALLALVVFVLAANLIGDGLRDAFDPTAATGTRRGATTPRAERRARQKHAGPQQADQMQADQMHGRESTP